MARADSPRVTHATALGALVARIGGLGSQPRRAVLGITGPPGAGKSTLAARSRDAFGGRARLSDGRLPPRPREARPARPAGPQGRARHVRRRGLRRPAASRTRTQSTTSCTRPSSGARSRSRSPPRSGSAGGPLVITEGNYLLVDDGPWAHVRDFLDEAWYVVQDEDTRLRLLIERHIAFGKEPDFARDWVMRSDRAQRRGRPGDAVGAPTCSWRCHGGRRVIPRHRRPRLHRRLGRRAAPARGGRAVVALDRR